jgi:four helix bundle protein
MFRFEQLEIWKLAISYADNMYQVASTFGLKENFALSDQLRRAAVSISNNIAEGSGGTNKDFSKYSGIAIKSTLETVNILYVAENQNYISQEMRLAYYEKAEEVIRKIRSLRNRLATSN